MAKRTAKRTVRKTATARVRKKVTPSASKAAASSNHGSLRVRMYRQGLGDCFLVTLPRQDGSPYYLMIDCGVILGTANAADQMKAVVKDIIGTTGGHIDLLAVTHEHWDHVSGFNQASELFAPPGTAPTNDHLTVGEVWLAWTEDPSDALANQLRQRREEHVAKLAGFVAAMNNTPLALENADVSDTVNGVNEVLSFFGVDAKSGNTANSTGAALDFARRLSSKVRYCRPTDPPAALSSVRGVRIYVLGPPHDEQALRKTDSSTEVYRELADNGAASSFFAAAAYSMPAADSNPEALKNDFERSNPFDKIYQQNLDQLKVTGDTPNVPTDLMTDFFSRYYFGRYPDPLAPDQSWRRIDADWLGAAAQFALQLDSATNNTSLVLAIELTDSGKVMLFAADAQVGNWLSWQNLSWKISDKTTVTGPDLLKQTAFYKVGHHGSHNATLRAKGLELMRTDDFVAFIPVNHAMAVKKHWGNMPLPGLIEALEQRSRGRVVRVDEDYTVPQGDDGTAASFVKNLKAESLFYEWTMPI